METLPSSQSRLKSYKVLLLSWPLCIKLAFPAIKNSKLACLFVNSRSQFLVSSSILFPVFFPCNSIFWQPYTNQTLKDVLSILTTKQLTFQLIIQFLELSSLKTWNMFAKRFMDSASHFVHACQKTKMATQFSVNYWTSSIKTSNLIENNFKYSKELTKFCYILQLFILINRKQCINGTKWNNYL